MKYVAKIMFDCLIYLLFAGWAIGPNYIIQSIMNAHQYIPFSVSTPSQVIITKNESYYNLN